ncbi:MAG: hypothetical protein M3Q66_10675 [Chloroflexota bacterium]|nr:hypothetical protein [Chloroflexota bacterium]
MTSAGEAALTWQVKAAGLPDPVLEHRFAAPRRWRFDIAFVAHKVAAEVEGGTWTNGRHSRGPGFELDCVKYAEAALAGWIVVRCTTRMVDDGRALRLVERALALREG